MFIFLCTIYNNLYGFYFSNSSSVFFKQIVHVNPLYQNVLLYILFQLDNLFYYF